MAPTSQKAGERPISFLLTGGSSGDISLPLVIRPEDLTRVEPSRLNVQQTLGGAWADNFGRGLQTINISGHTGWRGGYNEDGVNAFFKLREAVWTGWHDARETAVKAGNDPDKVKLVFADALDNITVSVAPGQFILKRNRTRPLLMMYQISMTVLSEDVAPVAVEHDGADGDQFPAGLDSLDDSIRRVSDVADQVQNVFETNIAGPVRGFLGVANTAMLRARGALDAVDRAVIGEAAQIVGFASEIAEAGRNAMYTYNAVVNQVDFARAVVSDVASAFDNAFCVLNNVFRRRQLYPDYTDIYGASNCSSTAGGMPLSPWRLGNPFEQVVPQYSSPLAVTPLAQGHIAALRAADPALAPMAIGDLSSRLRDIGSGVTFA